MDRKRIDRILNGIGFGILALVFVVSLSRVARSWVRERDPDRRVVRIVHTHLESGVREAMDDLIARYELLRPGVEVEQVTVPERLYDIWLETKLSGELAPDIVQVSSLSNEQILNKLVPLGRYIDAPNPYNGGTPLEGLPWRETFIDGLESGYNANLMEYYGVPSTHFTIRVFVNQVRYREIFGDRPFPQDYEGFRTLCEDLLQYREEQALELHPIAGSGQNARFILSYLLGTQTQEQALEIETTHELQHHGPDINIGFLRGDWDFETPGVRRGLEITREVARFFQPGFLQMNREDAMFYFLQDRALMLVTGSYDATSLRTMATFEIGAERIPAPSPEHPRYGEGMLGVPVERIIGGQASFGLSEASTMRDESLDFIRFLTSHQGASLLARRSGWIPAIREVAIPPELEPFRPYEGGYPNGFYPASGGDTSQAFYANLHLLVSPEGGIESFTRALEEEYRPAASADILRSNDQILNNSAYSDTALGAVWQLDGFEDPAWSGRISEIGESQAFQEEAAYLREYNLARYGR